MSRQPSSDPSGAARFSRWIDGLRQHDPAERPGFGAQRLIHPGLTPAEGNGLLATEPQGTLVMPGSGPQAITLLRFICAAPSFLDDGELYERDAMFGSILTLATDRLCQVVPEIFAQTGDGQVLAIPSASQVDSVLSAPLPDWDSIDADVRELAARMTSLSSDDAAAISAAMHMHYSASLLLARDLSGAFALLVGGIECLAQRFGQPPTEWSDWDQANSWDRFISENGLTLAQGEALRERLKSQTHMKLAETFSAYATSRLPDDFWEQPVRRYIWTIDSETKRVTGGSWSQPEPRNSGFGGDKRTVKKSFKMAYARRSQFLHAGMRNVTFVEDLFGDDPGATRISLSTAQLRASLRELILLELRERGDADPKGLDQIGFPDSP